MTKLSRYITPEDIVLSLTNTPQITFEVTDLCNLNCSYCCYGDLYNDRDPRVKKKMSCNNALNLLIYLDSLWSSEYNCSQNKNVYISFYGGEPLLNMKLIQSVVDFIEALHCKTRTFTFTMTTNALFLDKHIDYLVLHNFKLLISLDGDEENTAYRIDKKNRPAFRNIIKNVELCRKKYPEYFDKHVNFNAVLHNRNTVKSIYHFFHEHYNKIPRIGQLNNVGVRPNKESEFWNMYRNATENLFQSENYSEIESALFMSASTYNSAGTYLMQYSDFVYKDYNELLYGKRMPENSYPTGTCIPFSRKIFVTVNGKILPCERIGHQFSLGNISDKGVDIDFQKIADKYNLYYAKINGQCKSCYNRRACIQCMFNLPNIDGAVVNCHGYMNKTNFKRYENNQLSFFSRNPEAYSRIMNEVIFQ